MAKLAIVETPMEWTTPRGAKNVVGDHSQCAHVWAQNRVAYGRANDGRMYFENGAIYSYGSHFCIARFTRWTLDGRRIVLFTNRGYSVSTSKHISHVRRALHGLNHIIIHVASAASYGDGLEAADAPATIETLLRAGETLQAQIVAQLFARDGFRFPRNPEKWIADLDEERAKKKERDALENAKYHVNEARGYLRHGIAESFHVPANLDDVSSWQTCDKIGTIARKLSELRRAKRTLDKVGFKAMSRDVWRAIKSLTLLHKAWSEFQDRQNEKAHRAQFMCEALELAYLIRTASTDWRANDQTFLRNALRNAEKYGLIDCVRPIMSRVVPHLLEQEQAETFHTLNPDANRVREERKRARWSTSPRNRITAEQWLNGAAGSFYQENPTLVRRVADRLETSRGAQAPFAQAVAIFVKAQQCRFNGKSWHANGERYKAGFFELNSINENGDIRIGCHFIAFEEMRRLAVREVPHLVRAQFPLPAIVA